MQGPSQAIQADPHSQGPCTSRACHVPRVAACLEGSFLFEFQAFSVEFRRGVEGRWASVPAEPQIPTLVLLPPLPAAFPNRNGNSE